MREKDLKERTKQLGLETLRFSGKLPESVEYQMIRRQLVRAGPRSGPTTGPPADPDPRRTSLPDSA